VTDVCGPQAKADVLRATYDRITVAGRRIVSVRLSPSAYAHGFALALPEKVELARPTGFGRAAATIRDRCMALIWAGPCERHG